MPIPKRAEKEEKDAFLTRCMGDSVMNKEFPDQKRRYRVCEAQFAAPDDEAYLKALREAFEAEGETFTIKGQEIFAVGKWNGKNITLNDLHDFVNSFKALKTILRVPLKLGHKNKKHLDESGQPALGWVANIYVKDNKLLADFYDMPAIGFKAVDKKLYKQVSIEAAFGVEHKGTFYKNILTGVALLGADIPAVNTLKDLSVYMSSNMQTETLALNEVQCFSYNPAEERKKMDELEKLKADMAKLQDQFNAQEQKLKAAEKNLETATTEKDDLVKAQQEAEFTAAKDKVVTDLDSLVKAKKILPAKREELVNSIKDQASLDQVVFAASLFNDAKIKADVTEEEQGGKQMKNEESADQFLIQKINDYKAQGKSHDEATELVFAAYPDQAREYLDSNGEGEEAA